MIYILISISCSVIVSVLLKLAKRYNINIQQAITWNYLIALTLSYLLFKPVLNAYESSSVSIISALGILLPTLFIVLGLSVRYTGIVKTDIAQRLSLFIPLLASWLIFNEIFSQQKIAGIVIGLTAILFTIKWDKNSGKRTNKYLFLFPLTVFLGMGIIDILLKNVAQFREVNFTSSLFVIFCLAFLISMAIMIFAIYRKKSTFSVKNLICGLILGLFNFGNIWFYLLAHRSLSQSPSTVFSAMNMGVIIAGSLVGILVFREKLSKLNYVGLVLALISICIIALS